MPPRRGRDERDDYADELRRAAYFGYGCMTCFALRTCTGHCRGRHYSAHGLGRAGDFRANCAMARLFYRRMPGHAILSPGRAFIADNASTIIINTSAFGSLPGATCHFYPSCHFHAKYDEYSLPLPCFISAFIGCVLFIIISLIYARVCLFFTSCIR